MKRHEKNRLTGHRDKGLFVSYDRWYEDRTNDRARAVLQARAQTLQGLWCKSIVAWSVIAGTERADTLRRDLETFKPANVFAAILSDLERVAGKSLAQVPYDHRKLK